MAAVIPGRTLAVGGTFSLALVLLPQAWFDRVLICAVREFIGFPCPGCGLLRALSHLVHLEWKQAIALYPIAPLVLLGVAVYLFDEMRLLVRGGQPVIRLLLSSRWMQWAVGLIMLQWIARLLGLW